MALAPAFLLFAALTAPVSGGLADAEKNLVRNGDFSEGNVGFTSQLNYVEPCYNCLWPSGYTIAPRFNKPQLHTLIAIESFAAPVQRSGKEQVLFANAGGVEAVTVWQSTVRVQPKTQYRISFLCTSLSGHEDNGVPPRQVPTEDWVPNFEIWANKDVSPEFTAGMGKYYKAQMTWNSGKSTSATIKIVRTRFEHGGGLIGISNIEMVPVNQVAGSGEHG